MPNMSFSRTGASSVASHHMLYDMGGVTEYYCFALLNNVPETTIYRPLSTDQTMSYLDAKHAEVIIIFVNSPNSCFFHNIILVNLDIPQPSDGQLITTPVIYSTTPAWSYTIT